MRSVCNVIAACLHDSAGFTFLNNQLHCCSVQSARLQLNSNMKSLLFHSSIDFCCIVAWYRLSMLGRRLSLWLVRVVWNALPNSLHDPDIGGDSFRRLFNPLKPTVAIWVQL